MLNFVLIKVEPKNKECMKLILLSIQSQKDFYAVNP